MKKYLILLMVSVSLILFGICCYSKSLLNIYRTTQNRTTQNDSNNPDNYKSIWIVIDRISLGELQATHTPNLDKLQNKGAFGLMNVRTAGHLQSESTYLTANAGKRCQGSKMSDIGLTAGNGAVNDRIKELLSLNKETDYGGRPGLLGELGAEYGIDIAVIGNSDVSDKSRRTIVSMAMDSSGRVPYACIDSSILQNTDKPWGFETDYNKMKEQFIKYRNLADTIFVETGDISRIDYIYGELNDKFIENSDISQKNIETSTSRINNSTKIDIETEKKLALKKVDDFLGFILDNIDLAETQLAVLVPTPSRKDIEQGIRMSWLLMAGNGVEKGWLSSRSTRRKGVVTITDLLPTFLNANTRSHSENTPSIKLPSDYNNYIYSIPGREKNWSDLINLNTRITFIYNVRSTFIQAFILLQIVVIVVAISRTIWKNINRLYIFSIFFEYLLLALLLVPTNFMFLSAFNINTIPKSLLLLTALYLIEGVIYLKLIKKPASRILLSSGMMIILIIYNLLANYPLLADSILGYSSIIGARYYGLGNEYMGFFIGAYIVFLTVLIEVRDNKKQSFNFLLIWGSYIILCVFIGAGSLGANFGGMITALLSGGICCYFLTLRNGPGRYINKWTISTAAILFLLLMIFLDYSGIYGDRSHIGRAFEKIVLNDRLWILDTIIRKFKMNLKLLRWTIWTRVLLIMIIYLFVIIKKPLPGLRTFFEENHFYRAGLYSALAGSLLTMFVNDSGVVAAATILFYPLMSLLYFLDDRYSRIS